MDRETQREAVWDDLQESGTARFPFPPHGRLPNFAGAAAAAERLQGLDVWSRASVLKANPDAPQLPVRRAALRSGKALYMAVPRLAELECFLRLAPTEIEDIEAATTVSGSSSQGIPVEPTDVEPIDLIVSGSVAVTPNGRRLGKGEGYSDLEFAILREFGLVDESTTTVTTVHERQVIEEEIPTQPWDVPMDWVVTPDRAIETNTGQSKPNGISWEHLDEETIEEMPVLAQLQEME